MNRREEYQDERWKERAARIRELDEHRCAMCGAKDVELHVHHLSYPPPPFHIWDATDSELVTLCKDCHEKVHRSSRRPYLSEWRHLYESKYNEVEPKHDCRECMYHVQDFLLDDTEKWLFEYDGYCDREGGEGCCFKPVIRCEKCTFRHVCSADKDGFACEDYRERRCQYCIHYSEEKNKEGLLEDFCKLSGNKISWADDAEDCKGQCFVSRVDNVNELSEYLKQFK